MIDFELLDRQIRANEGLMNVTMQKIDEMRSIRNFSHSQYFTNYDFLINAMNHTNNNKKEREQNITDITHKINYLNNFKSASIYNGERDIKIIKIINKFNTNCAELINEYLTTLETALKKYKILLASDLKIISLVSYLKNLLNTKIQKSWTSSLQGQILEQHEDIIRDNYPAWARAVGKSDDNMEFVSIDDIKNDVINIYNRPEDIAQEEQEAKEAMQSLEAMQSRKTQRAQEEENTIKLTREWQASRGGKRTMKRRK